MLVVRWTFEDVRTGEVWTCPINPNEADSYLKNKSLDFGTGNNRESAGRAPTWAEPQDPIEWRFGGVIRSKEHHDQLVYWSKKKGKVRVTDHLGRTFEVMMRSFDPEDRRPTGATPWRVKYQLGTLLLRRIA